MASIAIMAPGAVLNAAAFTGGNYLAKYLSGDSGKAALDEKIRHDKALEQYQAAYAKYQKDRTKLLDWIATNDRLKHRHSPGPVQSDAPKPRSNQGLQRAPVLGLLQAQPATTNWRSRVHWRKPACGWVFCLSLLVNHTYTHPYGLQTLEDLLQPQGLLERSCRCQKTGCRG